MIEIDKNRKLYKQEGKCGAFQVSLPYITTSKMMRKYLPCDFGEGFLFFKNNYMRAVFYEENWRITANAFLKKYNDDGINDWLSAWRSVDLKLTDQAHKIYKRDLSTVDSKELQNIYEEIYKVDLDMWASAIFIDSFDIGVDQEKIEKISKKYCMNSSDIQVLLMPSEPSFISSLDENLLILKNGHVTYEELKDRFFWYGMDYSNYHEMDDDLVGFYLKELKTDETVEKIDKISILKKYGMNDNPFAPFALLAQWRDERKRLNYTGLYGLIKILREVAKRQNISTELVNAIRPEEFKDFFAGAVAEGKLRKRIEEGFFLYKTKEGDFEYYSYQEGIKTWKQVESVLENQEPSGDILKGLIASRGFATGRVKIILDPHSSAAKEINRGDVLVTSMTRPEFLPFMKMASAFVTDEGGISSHAAIVAREMKKPCIIGTKNATKVLEDGDLVEVDADKGIVRKVKSKGTDD
ncbi:MAG: PEP-utilizing enzyme [bacterium]|nr:PEP-utilizing enzyme [bacterium]